MQTPLPEETIIQCTCTIENGKVLWSDSCTRINWLITNYLIKVSSDQVNWTTLYQDLDDLRYWEHSYPYSEMHGGGPPMLECLTDITRAYKQAKYAVNEKLRLMGYEIIREEYHYEAFGSRYVVWSNHQHVYRLIWDGKENQFVFGYADSLPVTLQTMWDEVRTKPYDFILHDAIYLDGIISQITTSLE
jgi:hypothetical protein